MPVLSVDYIMKTRHFKISFVLLKLLSSGKKKCTAVYCHVGVDGWRLNSSSSEGKGGVILFVRNIPNNNEIKGIVH